MNLSAKIEAILFWKAEPIAIEKLAKLLNVEVSEIKIAIAELEQSLNQNQGGIVLVQANDEVMLGTNKELSSLFEQLTKDELNRDLGKAGLETLSIILYQGPISRAGIDYIRGVNSQFILRNLLIRGLIERVENPDDARSFLYKPTLSLLAHVGIGKIEDLPEYKKIKSDIESFKKGAESAQDQTATKST